ncbi:MAG TPA: 23S rRNA (guanosine(2251)-2'-O)-methyltransferase RlmB [Kofleriaceae bacterium]|nr:23S rRNA (guanosine(2251)-2'-O)-methyltransferase RlmB [Kofleriaceae bacterium]
MSRPPRGGGRSGGGQRPQGGAGGYRGDGGRGAPTGGAGYRGGEGRGAPTGGGRGDAARGGGEWQREGGRSEGGRGEGGRGDGGRGDGGRGEGGARGDGGGRGGGSSGPGERAVYGVGPVREVVSRRPQSVKALWVDPGRAGKTSGDPVAQIVTAARAAGVRVEDRERQQLEQAAGEGARHQGVVAWLGPFEYAQIEDMVAAAAEQGEPALLVALDGVEDPRNLGAILRSAYLLGAHGVIIPEHRAAQVTAVVAKSSAGASELVPIAQVGNLVRALEEMRDLGLWRVAVHAEMDAKPISEIDGTMPLVLVLGAEGSGVRQLVAKNCDFHALIPMQRSAVGSFNVSVAGALALYEMRRQRLAKLG